MSPFIAIDDYRLERVLGTGSFATVWLAHDERLDATVAIKVLADNWSRNPEVRRRFIDEARLLRRIEDERVVAVYSVNELPDGRPYFVMAWADRGTLLDRIDERRSEGGFDWVEATRIVLGVVDCLTVVHAYGVVHRDIKPSNVLLRSGPAYLPEGAGRERIVLGDFGLAKDTAAGSGFTLAAGTPAYMAPEQARLSADLDGRADLFAVTAIYYELLTGHPAFELETLDQARLGRRRAPVALADRRPGLPGGLQAVVDRGLALDPGRRYASAGDLASAIVAATEVELGPVAHGAGAVTVRGGGPSGPASPGPPAVSPLDAVAAVVAQAASTLPDAAPLWRRAGDLLVAPMRIAVIGDGAEAAAVIDAVQRIGVVTAPPSGDWAALADADAVIVVGSGPWLPPSPAPARRRPGGPAAVVWVGDPCSEAATPSARTGAGGIVPAAVVAPGADAGSRVADWLEHDARSWWPARRAAGALTTIEGALDSGAPAATDLAEQVERIRLAHPALSTVRILQDEAAGRLRLAPEARHELRRVLVGTTSWEIVGLLVAADVDEVALRAASGAARWRRMINTGQVPFAARAAADAVARTYDGIAAGTVGARPT